MTGHAVPSLGRRDQGVGIPLYALEAGGLGIHWGLNSIGLVGKDGDIGVMEERVIAVAGGTETRRAEGSDEELSLKGERGGERSRAVGRAGGRSSLCGRTSTRPQ